MNRCLGILLFLAIAVTAQAADWPRLGGPYLGQTPPGDVPELFAPGLVSTPWSDRDLIVSPDGTEIYFGMLDRAGVFVRVTRLVDGVWSEPVVPSFSADPDYGCLEQALSPDGNRIYFLSTRPLPDEDDKPGWGNQNIFCADRTETGWSDPYPAPGAVNTLGAEFYPSLTHDGTMYYTRQVPGQPTAVWRSRLVDGIYGAPERLPDQVNCGTDNYNAFISPDESFLILCIAGHKENLGPVDYWISFRSAEDEWSPAVNLGAPINGPETSAGSAYVSPDGLYLFYSATHADPAAFFPEGKLTRAGLLKANGSPENGGSDIYWVSAGFLEGLRER